MPLISGALLIDPKARQTGRKVVVQLSRADSKTKSVRAIVLPHHVTARRADGNAREILIARHFTRKRILTPERVTELCRGNRAKKCRREARHYTTGAQKNRHINHIFSSRTC